MDAQHYKPPQQWWSPQLTKNRFRFWRFIRRRIRVEHHRLLEVEIRGLENLTNCLNDGHGIMICPNHSCHADPSVMYWVADQLKSPFYFMAAALIFARANWLRRLILRQHGCFSVDRNGTDICAFRQAVEILQCKPYPLVIFPEGEIYHINKRITPFLDGPAAMALSASKRAERPISLVPCGIRYRYIDDPTKELEQLMDRLEERIIWRPQRHLILKDRIHQFAQAILGLKEREFLGRTQSEPLPERIKALSEIILTRLEEKYGIHGDTSPVPERVKQCRRQAIQLIEDETLGQSEHDAAQTDLYDLFVVIQLFSYPGNVSSGTPTIEEIAETMDKFEEDVLQAPTASIRGSRRAVVEFGKPILVERGKGGKEQIHALTEQLETQVQALLDGIEL